MVGVYIDGFIFFVAIADIISAIGGLIAIGAAAGGMLAVGNWLVSHPTIALILLLAIAVAGTIIKFVLIFNQDDTCWGISAIFSFLSVSVIMLYLAMYIVPLWIYYGGLHSVIETVASVFLFSISNAIFSLVLGFIFSWHNDGIGPLLAFIDFCSKLITLALLYLLNVDGIRYFLFDFLSIKAPFV